MRVRVLIDVRTPANADDAGCASDAEIEIVARVEARTAASAFPVRAHPEAGPQRVWLAK